MKKRKLKGFVLPTLFLLITISILTGIIFLGSGFELKDKDYDYGTPTIVDNVESVIVEDTVASSTIISPVEENIELSIHYYDYKENEEKQRNSLIYYENTYLPNTGIIYTSDSDFDVKTIFPGKVLEIKDDEFFGKLIVVEHNKNLKSYYYGLTDIEVEAGSDITEGTILGKSNNNKIVNTKKSFMLEVYFNNVLMNPENFIGTRITDYE